MKALKFLLEEYDSILMIVIALLVIIFILCGIFGVFDNNAQEETVSAFQSFIKLSLNKEGK